jgi:hypothetical protein
MTTNNDKYVMLIAFWVEENSLKESMTLDDLIVPFAIMFLTNPCHV